MWTIRTSFVSHDGSSLLMKLFGIIGFAFRTCKLLRSFWEIYILQPRWTAGQSLTLCNRLLPDTLQNGQIYVQYPPYMVPDRNYPRLHTIIIAVIARPGTTDRSHLLIMNAIIAVFFPPPPLYAFYRDLLGLLQDGN